MSVEQFPGTQRISKLKHVLDCTDIDGNVHKLRHTNTVGDLNKTHLSNRRSEIPNVSLSGILMCVMQMVVQYSNGSPLKNSDSM